MVVGRRPSSDSFAEPPIAASRQNAGTSGSLMRIHLRTPADQLHSACPRQAGAWLRVFSWAGGSRLQSSPFGSIESPPSGEAAGQFDTDSSLARLEAILFLAR